MMNYNQLQAILTEKNITMGAFCEKLNLTRQGFQKSMDNHTLPAKKIEEVCILLGFSPNQFFEWAGDDSSNEPITREVFSTLVKELEFKRIEINRLYEYLENREKLIKNINVK